MSKFAAVAAAIIGVLLLLPLNGIDQLGNVSEGIIGWLFALMVIFVGIEKIRKNYK